MTAPLPAPIRAYLRRFVLRRRRRAAFKALGAALSFASAWILLVCLLDWLLQFPKYARLLMLIAGALGLAAVLIRPLAYLLFRRIHWLEAAAAVEDAHPAFADRLRTVVSQWTERSEYRGSPEFLDQLLLEVTQHTQHDPPRPWVAWSSLLRPWCLAGLLLPSMVLLCLLPSLDMPTLIRRFIFPLASIPPVTTTRIALEPGDTTVVRGTPLTIRARVERLGAASVDIFTSPDASSWSRIPMVRASDGEYVFGLPSLDRDLYYYVRAGDAQTEVSKASVLHVPAIAQLRLRYEYPAYTQRAPLDVVSSDGLIEALVGTKVKVSIQSTQPLRSASLALSGQHLAMIATSDPALWQCQFTLEQDQSLELEMISAGGLAAKIPNALTLRAQPDRKPLVRLLQPAADLRLHPRALTAINYQAMDDYGITNLSLAVQVNSSPARSIALPHRGDSRRIEGLTQLDLATLGLVVGDVVTFKLVAQDGPGHAVSSDTRHILISPRAIDINTHQRIAEFRQSALLAATAHNELQHAAELLETATRTDGVGPEYITARVKASSRMAGGLEASLLLHQSLLRACAKSASAEQTTALAECVDRSRMQASACERLTGADGRGETERVLAIPLKEILQTARELSSRAKTLSEGEQAAAVLADLANLHTPPTSQPADQASLQRLQETLRRVQEDVNWAVEDLGLNPKASDLEVALQRKVDAANRLTRSSRPIDFAKETAQWLAALQQPDGSPAPLPERLASASSVEALRMDSDMVIARDLQLASRVGLRLAQPPTEPDPFQAVRSEFPQALAVLQQDHLRRRQAARSIPAGDSEATGTSAQEARDRLEQWATQPESVLAASKPAPAASAEELAMRASARTAERDYASAEAIDKQLLAQVANESSEPAAAQDLRRAVDRVRHIDDVSGQQQTINRQTAVLKVDDTSTAQRLSEQQQQVAERIYSVDETDDLRASLAANADSRGRATAAIQQVQEQLARMPQQLASALRTAEYYRQAVIQAEQAGQIVDKAEAENRAVAQRNVDQARRAVWDAEEELVEAGSVLSPDAAERMAKDLRAFRPEADGAISTLVGQLQPSLQGLQKAMHAADKDAVDRSAAAVRSAIEAIQLRLRDAQSGIIESDPLVSARWFAEAAAQSLAQQPADVSKARGHQQTVSVALGRAWQGAVHEASSVRLSLTPGYRPLLNTQAPPTTVTRSVGSLMEMLPGLHQWSFLRPGQSEALSAPAGQSDPAGFQDALRVYFEFLGKNQQQPSEK